ncbi:MAG: methyltransferase [Candidatus Eremiobacteraeota bacterium]|nr:methyltransferase [Candidatus Eremiobacteraeota bacterium]
MPHDSALTAAGVMEISNAYRQSAVLFAGHSMGVFDLIEKAPGNSELLAEGLRCDARAVEILLNALAAMGLLEKEGEIFRNSVQASRYLVKSSPSYLGALVTHNRNAWDRWALLGRTVKSGRPAKSRVQDRYLHENGRKTREFILAMEGAAVDAASALAESLDLGAVKRMLDVGGGPGTHSFEIIKRKGDIHAVIMDLPLTLAVTAKLVKKYGMKGRVSLREGDFLKDDYGSGYDLVLMSNVLHSNNAEQCGLMIGKAYDALNPGGCLVVKEYMLDESGCAPLQPALFSVNMLLNTEGGRSYRKSEIERWMKNAGFSSLEAHGLLKYTIIQGKRPPGHSA